MLKRREENANEREDCVERVGLLITPRDTGPMNSYHCRGDVSGNGAGFKDGEEVTVTVVYGISLFILATVKL